MKPVRLRIKHFPELLGIDDEVEQALRDKQKNRKFKDAGKRVRGSRKEEAMYNKLIRSTDLKTIEQDEASAIELVKKDKVFPKIEPQSEKQKGVESGCAFLKSRVRRAFPAKPHLNTKESREQYVKMAEAFIEVFTKATTINDLKELFTLATNGEIIPKTDFKMIFGSQLRNLVFMLQGYRYNTGTAKDLLNEAEKYTGISKADAHNNFLLLKGQYDKRIERIQNCIDTLQLVTSHEEMQKHRKHHLVFSGGQLSSITDTEAYVNYVTETCTRFLNDSKQSFENKSKQYPYVETKGDWSWADTKTAGKPKSNKPQIAPKPLSHIKRTGGLLVENADQNTVINTLHFKSLILGNYVKDNEANEHIKYFVSAIVDLCEVLDINLSINENLAIAFGAFGRGGKAMATYYPTRQLINLTKKRGDGSVAHEWGHFFDHYLNGFELTTKPLRSEEYLHTIIENLGYRRKYFIGNKSAYHLPEERIKSILKETVEKGVPDTILHQSIGQLITMLRFGYYMPENICTSLVDTDANGDKKKRSDSNLYHYSKKQGAYWSSIAEMFARSFECYVYDKLEAQFRENNYLVSGSNFFLPVYPQGEERKYINKCFDNLIHAVKEHLAIKPFEPFTSKRTDEYIELADSTKSSKNKDEPNEDSEKRKKRLRLRARAIILLQKQSA